MQKAKAHHMSKEVFTKRDFIASLKKVSQHRIDYDADGEPRGVELLCVSGGVITDDLPNRSEIERMIEDKGIKVYA